MRVIIIGCGGVGSWLAASMVKLVSPENVLLIDGDRLEKKNLDRQLFDESDIDDFKASALGRRLGCEAHDEWYSSTLMAHEPTDWLMACVDNHPARAAILGACDYNECSTIMGSNETHSAEAFVYRKGWRDTPLDPRVYYKEILEVTHGDPRAAAIGCTGEAQVENRQLVSANFMAAALMQHLFVAHAMEGPNLDAKARSYLPHRTSSNLSRLEFIRVVDTHNG